MTYDVVIIGAGTSGAYLARKLAERGHRVLAVDKCTKDRIGTKYDIFHIEEKEFGRFGLPRPVRGDPEWAFEFTDNYTADPMNLYPKLAKNPVVGLHMHAYTVRLNEWAEEAGAEFLYGAAFEDFLWEDGKIRGVICGRDGKAETLSARVVADCSGMFTNVRTKLPDDCPVENFTLGDEDMFYVILRYVRLLREADYRTGSCGWPFFKSWIAPCEDPTGAIVGIGACHSYDYADGVYAEMLRHIELPPHEPVRIEKGCTPYTRPPYSFVTDNFVVSGDAACLTKPINGEGVTSSMAHLEIVAKVLDRRLRTNRTAKEDLWEINVKYNLAQGADFAFTRVLLTGVVNAASFDEFEYAFESGLISDELMDGMNAGPAFRLPPTFLPKAAATFAKGVRTGRISKNTIKEAVRAFTMATAMKKQYLQFPADPAGFADWCKNTTMMWDYVGKIR